MGELPPWKEAPHLWETALLRILCEQIRTRLPALYAIFEEDDQLPNALRHTAYSLLVHTASSEPYRKRIREFADTIPLAFLRLPDNPIRFTYNAETGQLDGKDLHLASDAQRQQIKPLLRIFQPAPQLGRPRGLPKPKQSGRAPIDQKRAVRASQADQSSQKYKTPTWWEKFARKEGIPIPQDSHGREALRKKIESWACKGRRIEKVGE